jgi:DNA-directed RNA polymerase subunit RPC12/RpoP
MKFLCVDCDEPMKLTEAGPPDDGGSLTAVFSCPTCSHRIAMLTNPLETEMVTSLGIKIGPAGQPQEGGSRCPFSGVVREMEAEKNAAEDGVAWTAEALARLDNIPDFVRPMARQGIEHYARSIGHAVVDERILEEARERFGM